MVKELSRENNPFVCKFVQSVYKIHLSSDT